MALSGHSFRQYPHSSSPMHALRSYESSGAAWMLSGLQHHLQRREQPLRKTFVRIPGPSLVQKCWMLSTVPVSAAVSSDVRLMVTVPLVAKRDAQCTRGLHQVARRGNGSNTSECLAQRDTLDIWWTERDHHPTLTSV